MKRIAICINGASISEYKTNVPYIGKNVTYYDIYSGRVSVYYPLQPITRYIFLSIYNGIKEYMTVYVYW